MIPAKHKIQHNAHLVIHLTIHQNKSGREPLKVPGPTVSVCARHGAVSVYAYCSAILVAPAAPPVAPRRAGHAGHPSYSATRLG